MVIGNVADAPYSTVVADGVTVAVALLMVKEPAVYVNVGVGLHPDDIAAEGVTVYEPAFVGFVVLAG